MLCWIYAELDWFQHFAYSNLKSDLFLHNFSYSQKCVFSLLNSLILPCEVVNEFWLKWYLLPPIRTRWRVSRGLRPIQPVTCQCIKTHSGNFKILSLLLCLLIAVQEGVTLTIESLSHLTKDSCLEKYIDCNEQSKAEKLLGSGEGLNLISLFHALYCTLQLIT